MYTMICENCGKEHDGTYGSGRFCCSKCARSFSTKNDDNNQQKETVCNICGKLIYVNKRLSKKECLCMSCKQTLPKNQCKCKICGRTYYKYQKQCQNPFCQIHNYKQFNTLIKYFGFDKNKLGTIDVENEFNIIRQKLYDLYWNKKMSGLQIAEMYGYKNGHNLTQKIFKYLNIPTRSEPEMFTQNAVLTGRLNHSNIFNKSIYKATWYKTWDNKNVYLRSSYEQDYAKKLDEQKILYEVENLHIKYFDSIKKIYRIAIPDFYLPLTNTIIEIKSNYTLNLQEIKDKFYEYKKLGYNIKLILEHKEVDINTL